MHKCAIEVGGCFCNVSWLEGSLVTPNHHAAREKCCLPYRILLDTHDTSHQWLCLRSQVFPAILEQTISSFVPNDVVSTSVKVLGIAQHAATEACPQGGEDLETWKGHEHRLQVL